MKRHLLLIPATLLLLTAFLSGVGQLSFLRDSTTKQDWLQAARHVRRHVVQKEDGEKNAPKGKSNQASTSHLLPEDRILVWPAWRETPLPELVEVSQSLMWNDHPVLEDFQRARRLFLLTPADRVDEALDALPFPARAQIASRTSFDTVQVLEVSLPEQSTQWAVQLSDLLPEASVEIITESKPPKKSACNAWNANPRDPAWRCPGLPEPVGISFYELDDQPRYCILAHPPEGKNSRLRITFPAPDLLTNTSAPTTLRIRAGFDLRGARLAARNDELTLTVLHQEKQLAQKRYRAQTSTWEALDIDLNPQTFNEPQAKLTFEISALDAKHKLFCFNAWLGTLPNPS